MQISLSPFDLPEPPLQLRLSSFDIPDGTCGSRTASVCVELYFIKRAMSRCKREGINPLHYLHKGQSGKFQTPREQAQVRLGLFN